MLTTRKERIFVATPSYTQICAEIARLRCSLNWFEFGRAFPEVDVAFKTVQTGNIELAYQCCYESAKDYGADWFFAFEADMMPESKGHTFTTMWATVKRRNLDHLAALYFLNEPEEPWPLLFKEADSEMASKRRGEFQSDHRAYINFRTYPQNRIISVDGTGLGCTLIRMDALRRIEEESPYWRNCGESIFKINSMFSVDMAISWQLKQLGYELNVHSGVIVDHVSRLPMVINERHYQKQFAEVYWPADDADANEKRIAEARDWLDAFIRTEGRESTDAVQTTRGLSAPQEGRLVACETAV